MLDIFQQHHIGRDARSSSVSLILEKEHPAMSPHAATHVDPAKPLVQGVVNHELREGKLPRRWVTQRMGGDSKNRTITDKT